MKKIAILGSTGSIGVSALDVIGRSRDRYQVEAIAANRNITRLIEQIKRFKPKIVALADQAAAIKIKQTCQRLKLKTKIVIGHEGVCQVATYPTTSLVISAIVGQAGLVPTLEAIKSKKDIALANKETLVTAGALVMKAVKRYGVRLLPVDSEHAALEQCLQGHQDIPVKRLILTASGGPFANSTLEQLKKVTKKKALNHPTWSMGPKITIDSATLMNKGLEVIEAHYLFNIPYSAIEVVIHPQSIVHSMVEYIDGSTLAQLSSPDMRLPIQTALTAPTKLSSAIKQLDFNKGLQLTFGPPNFKKFPCLKLAYQAGLQGGSAPAVLNAANEIAVQAFLDEQIQFIKIPRIISNVLNQHQLVTKLTLPAIKQADAWARQATVEEINKCKQ